MAGRILLINPSAPRAKRKPHKTGVKKMAARKKPRSAAQKAATRKMLAANRARRKPVRARRTAKRRTLTTYASNPIKRRKRRASTLSAVSVRRRRRSNPIKSDLIKSVLMPSITAAGGALMLDVAWGYLPIPANLKTGPLQHLAKGVGALAIGYLGSKVVKKQTAEALAVGALTVVFHGAAKDLIAKMMPSLRLGMVNAGYPAGTYGEMGEYISGDEMGQYIAGDDDMGEYISGATDSESAYANYY